MKNVKIQMGVEKIKIEFIKCIESKYFSFSCNEFVDIK